jgi:excisionase family DNA binding protein
MEQSIENRISKLEQSLFIVKNILSFGEASEFLNLSKSYLYKLTSSGQIPHYKPQGKMLYFERSELETWLRQNPIKTNQQIMKESESRLMNANRRAKQC